MGTKIQRKQFYDDGWIPANETWTYASADDPTYTFTISAFDATAKYNAGMKVKLTQSTGGTKFAFITKVVFDDPGSTITCYFGTEYNLENEAITAPYYSLVKAPFGFPLDPAKWSVIVEDVTLRTQATPTSGTWYNIGSMQISVPIGNWIFLYEVSLQASDTAGSDKNCPASITLSTANNSESSIKYTSYNAGLVPSSSSLTQQNFRSFQLITASKTLYYLNAMVGVASLGNIYFRNDLTTMILQVVCAYL